MQMRTSIKRVGCRLNTTSPHPSYYDDFSILRKHILWRDVAISVKRCCLTRVLITSRNIFRQCHPPSGPSLLENDHASNRWMLVAKVLRIWKPHCGTYFVNRINESILFSSARISIILQTSSFNYCDIIHGS